MNLIVAMSPALGFLVAGTIAITFWIGSYLLSALMIRNTVRTVDQMSEDQSKQAEEEDRAAKDVAKSH